MVLLACLGLLGGLFGSAGGEAVCSFQARLRAALDLTQTMQVVYRDVLGEGPGHWDDDPLVPAQEVNCLTWIQIVLAHAYGGERGVEECLRTLRYYGGVISFGTRKHFIDLWTTLDPGPLKPLAGGACVPDRVFEVTLDPQGWLDHLGFPCPSFEAARRVRISAYSAEALQTCLDALAPGIYLSFPVANQRYLASFGQFTGPMIQVHGLFLERGENGTLVHHASFAQRAVIRMGLPRFLLRFGDVFQGYALYRLDENWSCQARSSPVLKEAFPSACERALDRGQRRCVDFISQ